MSKRRKTQISEGNKELGISKTKKSLRKKAQLTRESDLETSTQTFQTSNYPSIVSINQEDKKNVMADQDISSGKESKMSSYEWKELDHTKILLPASQGGKLVPKFTNTKKTLMKTQEGNFEETAIIWKNEAQHMDRNITNKPENTIQNRVSFSESTEMINLPVTNTESPGDHIIPNCEKLNEWLDVKMQNQNEIVMINNSEANSALSDFYQETEIKLNSQESYCEKEMSQKQVSPFLCSSSNNDVNFSEKTEVATEPFKCQLFKQMNEGMLVADRVNDHIKSSQDEKECLGCLDIHLQQNQSMQVTLKSDETDYSSWTKNGNRKGSHPLECTSSQIKKENAVTELPVVTPGKLNLCTASTGEKRSADAKKIDWILSDKNGKSGEQNDSYTCSSIEISESGCCKSRVIEKATDQHNLETNGKPVEKGISGIDAEENKICRREATVEEENSIKDQDISEKSFAYIQPVCPYFEKEVNHSEPPCDQVSPSFLQCDEDVLSENKDILMQDTVCKKECICNSAEANVPILFIQKQQNKSCSENTQQSEFNRNTLIANVVEAVSSNNIAEKKMIKISKAEISDNYIAGEELAQCEENNSKADHVERSLFCTEVPLTKVVLGDPCKDINADSEVQSSFTACGTDSSMSASCDFNMVAQTCSPYPDPFPLDLEFLPESQLQSILESHSLEVQSQKTCFLNNLPTHSKDKSNHYVATKHGENKTLSPGSMNTNTRDEIMERTCDPSIQEDATDIVCGLIKELSNLNRLIMNTHRDLDSFKRMKFRKNRQHGKLLSHNISNLNTLCAVKKKREL